MQNEVIAWASGKPTESAVDYVIRCIRTGLESGELKPGERLPSETELATMLSVSRGSIREAMKILSAFGVVSIQRGNGTYISSSEDNLSLDPVLFRFILAQPSDEEIRQFRLVLEGVVLRLAIQNATEKDMDMLQKNIDQMASCGGDPEHSTVLEMEFHDLLGGCVKNRLIQIVYGFAMKFFEPSINKTHSNQESAEQAIALHKHTLRIIRERDVSQVDAIIQENIDTWNMLSQ